MREEYTDAQVSNITQLVSLAGRWDLHPSRSHQPARWRNHPALAHMVGFSTEVSSLNEAACVVQCTEAMAPPFLGPLCLLECWNVWWWISKKRKATSDAAWRVVHSVKPPCLRSGPMTAWSDCRFGKSDRVRALNLSRICNFPGRLVLAHVDGVCVPCIFSRWPSPAPTALGFATR